MSEENKKGCFFWGCLVLIIIAIIAGLCIFLIYRKITNTVNQFTSETPVAITPVEYTREEENQAKQKVKTFIDEIKDGKETVQQEFSDKELNILIASDKKLKDKGKLVFENNKIKAKINVSVKKYPNC